MKKSLLWSSRTQSILNTYNNPDDEQSHLEELGIREQYYITLAGEKARVTTFTGDENYTYVQTIHDGKVFSFMTSPWKNETGDVSLTGTILSTFKFLK